jgi:hypothetical protein
MAKIDELIRQAQGALNKAKEEDKAAAQARLDALEEAKKAGVEMSNDEVNGVVTRRQAEIDEKWKGVVGMSREQAEKFFEELNDDDLQALIAGAAGSEGDGSAGGTGDKPPAERIAAALKERDAKIETLSNSFSELNRTYAKDKVDVAVREAFRSAGLDEKYLGPAKSLAAYDDLVEKLASGQPVTTEEIGAKVESVKGLSGVWFGSEAGGGEGNGSGGSAGRTVAGVRIKEDAVRPHIPATPEGRDGSAPEITDEDRAARATSVY